jgi:aminoglycoside phosphotransferase (APT) family kinase protein
MSVDEAAEIAWFERGLNVSAQMRGLDSIVDEALKWISELSPPFDRFEGPLRFTHNDLSPDHVIVDAKTGKLAGIIDWSDATLGDPARDFVFLVTWRGWPFAEEILRAYPHSLDRGFRDRLRFVSRLLSVMWLAEAYERHGDVTKHIAWVRNAHTP